MAIVFTKGIDLNKLRMAYNNDVIKFYSNVSTALPVWCEIAARNVGSDVDRFRVRIYPAPDGTFYFNFRQYISSMINTRNFEDTTNIVIGSDIDSCLYNFREGTYLNQDIFIVIMHSDDTNSSAGYNLSWLAGVEQLGSYNIFDRRDYFIMTPFKKLTDNHVYLKYWQGYPFDISLFTWLNGNYTLKNNTNILDANITIGGNKVYRLAFSDGRTDETLEDFVPLVDGFNKLTWSLEGGPVENNIFITMEKVPYKCGIYFKWLNKYGGYSYWLFENTYSIDRASKQLGELDRNNENLEYTFNRDIQIGKDSNDTVRAIAELLTEDERMILEGIIDSPKIYMFTGQPLARNNYRDWIEVSLKTSNVRVKNPKQELTNIVLDFELPQRYTQTL